MNSLRIAGVVVGSILSLFFQALTVVAIQLSWGDSTVSRNPVWLLPVVVPLLFSVWFVYRCFRTDEMEQLEILWWIVRPQALRRTLLTEACVAVIVFCLFAAWAYALRRPA